MMKRIKGWFLVGCFLMLAGCAAPPVIPPDYGYGEKAIDLNLIADPMINLYQDSAHTLLVCVYQLRDPNAFNQRAGTTPGLYELLQCNQFDPSVTNAERIILYPGKDVQRTIDRAEGTRYVAIAAGYYNLGKDSTTRLFPIPVKEESLGFFSRQRVASPAQLIIDLEFGPQKIEE